MFLPRAQALVVNKVVPCRLVKRWQPRLVVIGEPIHQMLHVADIGRASRILREKEIEVQLGEKVDVTWLEQAHDLSVGKVQETPVVRGIAGGNILVVAEGDDTQHQPNRPPKYLQRLRYAPLLFQLELKRCSAHRKSNRITHKRPTRPQCKFSEAVKSCCAGSGHVVQCCWGLKCYVHGTTDALLDNSGLRQHSSARFKSKWSASSPWSDEPGIWEKHITKDWERVFEEAVGFTTVWHEHGKDASLTWRCEGVDQRRECQRNV